MTRAPENLLAARRLLLDHLDVDEDRRRDQDLEPAEVGIVGDPAHRGGYHCGSDRVVTRDYSVAESPRDSAGLTDDASALDVGYFWVTVNEWTHTLRSFSTWCVEQCEANTPDSRDIREIIYSPDGKVVRRWDRLRKRVSGDSSHLWHTHISFFRDAIKAGRDQTPLFRRYLQSIGLISGGVDELFCKQGDRGENVIALQTALNGLGAGLKVDGGYGAATAAAVKEHIGGDGTEYRGIHFGRMQIALAKRFAGQAGPQGLAGPQGEPGPQGPAGPPGGATVDQVVNELVVRLGQGQARE